MESTGNVAEPEVWIDIKGFEGSYQVSSMGNLRSVDRVYLSKLNSGMPMVRKGIILKGGVNYKGYGVVNLNKEGVTVGKGRHRWVALNFLDNPLNLPEVNHKDGDKTNNKVSNLEWCTSSYNSKHAYALGLKNKKGEKHGMAKLTNKIVLEIRDFYSKNPHAKLKVFSEKLGVTEQLIYQIRSRRAWTHI